MAQDQWGQIRRIFDEALRHSPDKRSDFIRNACGDDPTILSEVESLLSSLRSSDDFLETPAAAHVADILPPNSSRLERGSTIGHYEIIEQIGVGGMGEVYLARDSSLNRKVAIKLLSAAITEDKNRVSRFRQEALATSALNHPNIVTIYEVGKWEGRDFIVTELIDGQTLRSLIRKKKQSISEILDIVLQTASALAAAHGAGIVHRDIKPENIMVRANGLVKVLDFGIAKYRPGNEGQKALVETAAGEIIGTAAYMSPEQARGLDVDEQTDIWSLGVILYELLARKLPFDGKTKSDRIAAILEREPAPILNTAGKFSPQLQQILNKALAKDKDQRYADVGTMAEDLHLLRDTTGDKFAPPLILPSAKKAAARSTRLLVLASVLVLVAAGVGLWFFVSAPWKAALADRRSIVVLPLRPIGATNRDEIYEIGIADSLIQRIGSMKNLVVRPLSSVRKYDNISQDPIAAGREQQADYVLSSSYQLAGGKIRVTSELLDVATGEIVDTYKSGEKNASEVFATQDQIASEMGNLVLTRFSAAEAGTQTAQQGTTNEEAYRLYLQGMFFYDRRTKADSFKAVEVLEQAVRLDPNYARAWAGLAHAHSYLINLGGIDINIPEHRQISMDAVNKAIALDSSVSEAYSAMCDNKMYFEYDFAGAETACKRSVELKPNSPLAHNTYSRFLFSRGRFDEAISEIKTAIELEPTSYFHQIVYLTILAQARRYDEAARQMDRVAELNPKNAFRLYWQNAGALMTQGSSAEAFERWMRYLKLSDVDEQTVQLYQRIYQTDGWPGVLREQAGRVTAEPAEHYFLIAAINAQAGDKDRAMDFLERSYKRRELWMVHLQVEPRLDSLRDDPRFQDLVRRVEQRQ